MKGHPDRLTHPTNLAAICAELAMHEGDRTIPAQLKECFDRRIRDEGSESFVNYVIGANWGHKLKWPDASGIGEEEGQTDD